MEHVLSFFQPLSFFQKEGLTNFYGPGILRIICKPSREGEETETCDNQAVKLLGQDANVVPSGALLCLAASVSKTSLRELKEGVGSWCYKWRHLQVTNC